MGLADDDGVASLSLRRLAALLHVTPMALYRHVKDKDDLLDGLVQRLLSEVDLAGDDGADLRSIVSAVLRVLRQHPTLAEIVPTRSMRTRAGIDLAEKVVGLLREEGHSPVDAAQLSIFLLDAVIGLVTRQPGELAVADPTLRRAMLAEKRKTLQDLEPEAYPNLTTSAEFFLGVPDEETYFSNGLAILLNATRPIR
jgi:TetR/AcrR family transcriptional regulator, tetracycline repressor protein